MSAYRATKSGFSKEAQEKVQAKYDSELAGQCLQWIKSYLAGTAAGNFDTNGSQENVYSTLKDGFVLANFMNVLKPGSVPASKLSTRQKMPFKQMELIELFITQAKSFGVPDPECFMTCDLYESQNLHQVVMCLQSLGRKAQHRGLRGFGPAEAEQNRRQFTQQQLEGGKQIIGLQMGTNKGASQAGMSFGKTRKIVD